MDESMAKQTMHLYVEKMRWALGLQMWKLHLNYDEEERSRHGDALLGICRADVGYERASINVRPSAHEDVEELLFTLRHEMLHVFHADFATYRAAVGQYVNQTDLAALDEIYEVACERLVKRIEDMLELQLGLTAKQMMERARRQSERKSKQRSWSK